MARKNINPKTETAARDESDPRRSGDQPETTPDDGRSFEELLAEAESLAQKIEEGGLPLDEAIRAYERGVADLRRSAELLRRAEDKVKVLLEHDGAFRLEDFDDGDVAGDTYEDEA